MPSTRVRRFVKEFWELNKSVLENRDYREDISDTFPDYLPKDWTLKNVSLGFDLCKWTVYAFVYYYGEESFVKELWKWYQQMGMSVVVPEGYSHRSKADITRVVEHIEKRIDEMEKKIAELKFLLEHIRNLVEDGTELEVDLELV